MSRILEMKGLAQRQELIQSVFSPKIKQNVRIKTVHTNFSSLCDFERCVCVFFFYFDIVCAAVAAGEQTELLVGLKNDGNKHKSSCFICHYIYQYLVLYIYIYICVVCNAVFKMFCHLYGGSVLHIRNSFN